MTRSSMSRHTSVFILVAALQACAESAEEDSESATPLESTAAATAAYSIVSLMPNTASGGSINEAGQVAAFAGTAGFLWTNGQVEDVGFRPVQRSFGLFLNDDGGITGLSSNSQDTPMKAFAQLNGNVFDLSVFPQFSSFENVHPIATALTGVDKIVVGALTSGQQQRAFRSQHGVTQLLTGLGGASLAVDINAFGQIVGSSVNAAGQLRAVKFVNGQAVDLGTFGGLASEATAISARGEIVGGANYPGEFERAFVIRDGAMHDLGTLGGLRSIATGINAAGDIIGDAQVADGDFHPFIYRNGAITDLHSLIPPGFELRSADDINSAGQIVVTGLVSSDPFISQVFLLTPTQLTRLGFAWAHQPSEASYTPSPTYAFNSAGGPITITRGSVGAYTVAFENLAGFASGVSSAAAVTTYGSSTSSCTLASFVPAANRTVANVACVDTTTGARADSLFTVAIVGSRSLPINSAFLTPFGASPRPDEQSWTSGRVPISSVRNGTGDTSVILGTGNTADAAKLVTAIEKPGARCQQSEGISGGLRVKCWDGTSTLQDTRLAVVQVAGGRPGHRAGFGFADQPTIASYTPAHSFNSSGGAITATRTSVGHYLVRFNGLQRSSAAPLPEDVQVSPVGNVPASCNVVAWVDVSGGLEAQIECRNGSRTAPAFIDTRYHVLVLE